MSSSSNCIKNKTSKISYIENKENFENDEKNYAAKNTTDFPLKNIFSKETYEEKIFLHQSNNLTRYPLKDINQQDKLRRNVQVLNKKPSLFKKNSQKEFSNASHFLKHQTFNKLLLEETSKSKVTKERENHNHITVNNSNFSFLSNTKVDKNDNAKIENENLLSPLHTPFNNCELNKEIENIKQIRKHASRTNFLSDKLNKQDINNFYSKTRCHLSNNETLCLTEDFMNFKYTNAYSLPGVVYLDPKDNHVSYCTLYSIEYLDFIFEHQFKKECEYSLSELFLKKYTITNSNRSIVVNWMIKLQTYLKNEHTLIYTAVRIMDKTIDSMDIQLNKLQLVALASYWMALKFHAVDHKDASWMVKQSCGAYTNQELILMEQEVFRANDFNINIIDFSVYVHYYILKLQLLNADIISQCTYYILDCAMLDSRFVCVLPSMLVAASIYTALILMNQYTEEIWRNLNNYKGFYESAELKRLNIELLIILKCVNHSIFPCREPYYKYSSSRYCNVTHILADALIHN